MSFRISGKNIDVGDALRERVSRRIAEAMGKYFDGGYSGHVTLERDGFGFRTECAIHLDSKITLHAARRRHGGRCLRQRGSGCAADREAVAPLSSPVERSPSRTSERSRRYGRGELRH